MTLTFAELAGPADADYPPDFKRDQWGRPSIMQPNGKRKGYTRCSSAAKTIEDTFNLERYDNRNICYGVAYDSSLVARVIALGGDPSTWGKAEKDEVNAICDAARTVAKAHRRADIGTAIHHLTHRLDRGETVNGGPYQADLDAYAEAMKAANLTVEERYIECRMVNDDLEMAGTADRIVYNMTDFVIADIKTGSTVDFGSLGWAAQLAAYAGGSLYDPAAEERLRTPPINRHVGYIIHLPAGEGRCTIYEVDIAAGLEAARLANQIRATRKAAKSWLRERVTAEVDPDRVQDSMTMNEILLDAAGDTHEIRRLALLKRYQLLNDEQKINFTQCLDLSAPDCGRDDLDNIEAILNHVDPIQTIQVEPPLLLKVVPQDPPTPPDEGGPVELADVLALSTRYENLSPQAKAWTGALVSEGNRVWTFRIRDRPTVRRYELYRGILTLAETFWGEG